MPASPRSSPSRRRFLAGAAGGLAAASASSAAAQVAADKPGSNELIRPQDFGAIADGAFDCTDAMQRAVDASLASGVPIYCPPGVYRIGRGIRAIANRYFAHAGAFGAGIRIVGAGVGSTIFEFSGDGALFEVDTAVDHQTTFRAQLGCVLEGFSIRPARSQRGNGGVKLRAACQVRIRDMHIVGLAGDAVTIECLAGDNDGSNMVSIEQVRIEDCAGWGISIAAAPGHNEISFVHLQQVFVQGCGTANGGTPASGGMKWKGQVCTLDQCAFTLNRNVALFVPGEAGLAQTLELRSTAFENNYQRHMLVSGITGLTGSRLQFYSNDPHPVDVALELDGGSNTVRYVDLDGVVVRATRGNRLTAFKLGGPHAERDSCRIRNVVWENFDYPGQSRFDGFVFDHVEQCCELRVASAQELNFGPNLERPRGNTTPLRLRGGAGGAPSTTGEWIAATVVSPLVLRTDGLSPGRRWFVYLYDDLGVRKLAADPEGPVLERLSGYAVHPRDSAKLCVGSVHTDEAGQLVADQA
jgi:hypothetical protein